MLPASLYADTCPAARCHPPACVCRAAALQPCLRCGARASMCSAYTRCQAASRGTKRCAAGSAVAGALCRVCPCCHRCYPGASRCRCRCGCCCHSAAQHTSILALIEVRCRPLQVMESWKLILGSGRMRISVDDVRIFASDRCPTPGPPPACPPACFLPGRQQGPIFQWIKCIPPVCTLLILKMSSLLPAAKPL